MADKNYRPNMKVKITLNLHWQNKLLSLLATHCRIYESYPEPHVIYMSERNFVALIFAAQKAGHNLTLDQLKAEYVDLKKEPQITVVRPFMNYQRLEKEQ